MDRDTEPARRNIFIKIITVRHSYPHKSLLMAGIGHVDVPSLTLKLDGHINLQTDLVFHSMNISTRKVTLPVFYLLCLGKTLVDKKSN